MTRPTGLELRSEELGDGLRVLRVCGELDLTSADPLQAELQRHLSSADVRLVVDLSECTFIDSSAIRALLHGTRSDGADGADAAPRRYVVVVVPGSAVGRVFELVGLSERLPLAPDRKSAIAGFGGSVEPA